jgi:dolichol-phosphate mannosyltransferase
MMPDRMPCTVSLVLPARNEADGIARVVQVASSYCDELLVVDGHSTDLTAERAAAAGARVVFDHGVGKGDAYQVGIAEAKMDIVVFMDADGSHEPADIPRLVAPIRNGEADFVVASRHRGGSDEWRGDLTTWLRAIGSGFLSVVINWRFRSELTDVLNGFRAVRRDKALTVRLRAMDFDVEQHMICQYLKAGLRVTEIGSHEYERAWGCSKLPTYRKAYLFFSRLAADLLPGGMSRP